MKNAPELLRAQHLRVTAPRIAVLDVLAERSHLTTDEVATAVRERIGALSMQAAYHVLDTLVCAGLLRRIEPAGSAARYECRVGDNHHHLVCRNCGEVADVDCDSADRPCVVPPDGHGFEVDEAEVIFWGRCPVCRSNTPQSTLKARSST
ncbi:MAG: Fur family transcriptional regulator [Dermatophilaceae bacterium]